jgi:hypothetical protein
VRVSFSFAIWAGRQSIAVAQGLTVKHCRFENVGVGSRRRHPTPPLRSTAGRSLASGSEFHAPRLPPVTESARNSNPEEASCSHPADRRSGASRRASCAASSSQPSLPLLRPRSWPRRRTASGRSPTRSCSTRAPTSG